MSLCTSPRHRRDRLTTANRQRVRLLRASSDNEEADEQERVTAKLSELQGILGVNRAQLPEILRRDPELLAMPSLDIAAALVALKVAFPTLDILELIRRKPQLLRNQNGVQVVQRSIRDLQALMPALPVLDRLFKHGDGQMWQSFRERMAYWEQVDSGAGKDIMFISTKSSGDQL